MQSCVGTRSVTDRRRRNYHAEIRRLSVLGWERPSLADAALLESLGFESYGDAAWRAEWETSLGQWYPGALVYIAADRSLNPRRRLRRLEALIDDPDLVAALHAVWISVGPFSTTHGMAAYSDDPYYSARVTAVENYLTDLGLGRPRKTIARP